MLKFLDRLEKRKLTYRLEHWRESIAVELAVPGERWEVEFFEDGHIEIERFVSSGVDHIDEDALMVLVDKLTD